MRRRDRSGERNGKLTLTRPAPSTNGHSYWFANCECGREIQVASSNISRTTSCGCGREDYLSKSEWVDLVGHTRNLLLIYGYIPASRTYGQGARKGVRGHLLCRCTRCSSWVRATPAAVRSQKVVACETCTPRFHEEMVRRGVLWADEAEQRRKTKHSFYAMHRRVGSEPAYKHVRVCERWQGHGAYDRFERDMRLRPHAGLTLDRIDPDGDYSPENCRWADRKVQDRNKTTSRVFRVAGECLNLVDLSAALGCRPNLLSRKLRRLQDSGMTDDSAAELLLSQHHTRTH